MKTFENDTRTILLSADSQNTEVPVWFPCDIAYTVRHAYPWNAFPLQVMLTHEDQPTQLTLDAYWCGGHDWRIRFAPPKPGHWTWRTVSSHNDPGLEEPQGSLTAIAPKAAQIDGNPNFRGHLRICANQRYFEYADGTPFFWIGDTNWPLNTVRCGLEPDEPDHDGYVEGAFYVYVNNRKAKGFSVIQTSLWRSLLSGPQRNEAGYPFPNNTYDASGQPQDNKDFSVLNPEYFDKLDQRMRYVWEQGFVVSGHPNWIGRHVAMNLDQAIDLERYLLARYGAFNLIYSVSGEYHRGMQEDLGEVIPRGKRWTVEDYRKLGRATAKYNAYGHPLTIHPDNPKSSGDHFHEEIWVSHNWIQAGGGKQKSGQHRIAKLVTQDYQRTPPKPVVHSEGQYEGSFMSYRPEEASPDDICTADVARFEAWAAFMNGACGHTYGSHGIWQFFDPYDTTGDKRRTDMDVEPWWHCLDREAAADMIHIKEFFEKIGLDTWMTLAPSHEKLRINGATPNPDIWHDPFCLASDNALVVYIPRGNQTNTIEIIGLQQGKFTAQWYNPRNGATTPLACEPPQGNSWKIPARADDLDWVLWLRL